MPPKSHQTVKVNKRKASSTVGKPAAVAKKRKFDEKSKPVDSFNKEDVKQQFAGKHDDAAKETTGPLSKHEGRIQAKELTEARKKRRKRHYTLEQELALLWEKMRRRNIAKEDRSKLVSEAIHKMKGKIHEIAGSHVSSRVLQTCTKYCTQPERDIIFEELQPHLLGLSRNTYAVFLVKKLLDSASKKQLAGFISSLHGNVARLLRHMVGSVVIEHAYHLGNAAQNQQLLVELYSPELQLFKDLASIKESRPVVSYANHSFSNIQVLTCILTTVDDTKIITKVVIRELKKVIKEVSLDKNGRRIFLQLLHPNCTRYLSPDDLASLSLSIPSLCNQGTSEVDSEKNSSELPESGENALETDGGKIAEDVLPSEGGKKDPYLRRQELLINSGLAESLIDTCIENTGEFLRSIVGREVLYEVAIGGADGILLYPSLKDKLGELHEAICTLAAEPKCEDSEEEHVLENFHSSRTIRKLILDSPTLAVALWMKALKGNAKTWAQGHSGKIVSAYLESSSLEVREMAKKELQPLVDQGLVKIPETKQQRSLNNIC